MKKRERRIRFRCDMITERRLRERQKDAERYESYLEAKKLKDYEWEAAFQYYVHNARYIHKHSKIYRHGPIGIILVFLLALIAIVGSMVGVDLFLGKGLPVDHLVTAGVIAALLIMVELYAIADYLGTVGRDLSHAIFVNDVFTEVWPDIARLAEHNLAEGTREVPEEPERAIPKSTAKKSEQIKVRIHNENNNSDDDIVVII